MLLASALPIVIAFAIVTLARGVVVGVASGFLRLTKERTPWSWTAVLVWGGLRGGLSMVLALGLAPEFPHRELLITMTYGVVVLSILVQGLSMTPLLRALGLVGLKEERHRYEIERGELRAVKSALAALERMEHEGGVQPPTAAALRGEYHARQEQAEQAIRALHLAASELEEEDRIAARRHLLQQEKRAVLADTQKGFLSPGAAEHLQREIDARLFRLDAGEDSFVGEPSSSSAPPVDGPRSEGSGATDGHSDEHKGEGATKSR